MSNLPATSAKPEIIPVDDLLDNVLSGETRVPRFQRPYIWSPEDMVQLFDSVLRGYPIGSLLIWQTDRTDITSLTNIGPITVTEKGPALKSYVVDGHQRLATLLGVLRLPENYPRSKIDEWRWWIAYDLKNNQFVHLKDGEPIVPLHLLPLRNILRTVDFARRTREIISSNEYSEDEANALIDRADVVQRSIRDYRIPLTVMRSGSLDDAVTIFSRVNQRGRDMTADQMVSALTFRDREEGDFDLSGSIDNALGNLREVGFGDLERRLILQVILAIAQLDFTRPTYDRIVNRDSHALMRPAVKKGQIAMRTAAEFLRDRVGLKISRLLPYASIFVMLAIYFDQLADSGRTQTEKEIELVKKWFWATSFNGWFAGANTTEIRQAASQMRLLASGQNGSANEFERFFIDRPLRPFPEAFDRRSARVRASLLVQIIAGSPLDPHTGDAIDGFSVFTSEAARDIPYFFPNKRRPMISNPANRVILPAGYPRNARAAFTSLGNSPQEEQILRSHFISDEAFEALKEEDFENFISIRERSILNAENHFLMQFGLALDSSAERNIEENDSDE